LTIRLPDAPSNGHRVIAEALADIGAHPILANLGAKPEAQASKAIRVFTVALEDCSRAGLFDAARPTGWRYIVTVGGEVFIADLGEVTANGPEFQGLTRGGLARRLAVALAAAETAAGTETAVSELRLLEIPAVYISAIWLHGDRDRFIPFVDASRGPDFAPALQPDFPRHLVALAEQRRDGRRGAGPTAN
jgi:hypothetical protein